MHCTNTQYKIPFCKFLNPITKKLYLEKRTASTKGSKEKVHKKNGNRSAKSCQIGGTEIRWRTEQLFVGVTRMLNPINCTGQK